MKSVPSIKIYINGPEDWFMPAFRKGVLIGATVKFFYHIAHLPEIFKEKLALIIQYYDKNKNVFLSI